MSLAPKQASGSTEPETLDVRTLPHGGRHEIIFGRFDELELDEQIVILNDHDPRPLRFQMDALWPGKYEWNYLESGPQEWQVAITRVL